MAALSTAMQLKSKQQHARLVLFTLKIKLKTQLLKRLYDKNCAKGTVHSLEGLAVLNNMRLSLHIQRLFCAAENRDYPERELAA